MPHTEPRPSPHEWNNDGHLLRVTLEGDAGIRFAVICPSRDADLAAMPFDDLPSCRQTYDEFGTRRIDWAPAKECSVELHAGDLSLDELFDEAPEFEVASPVQVEYRWSGHDADSLHLRPVTAERPPAVWWLKDDNGFGYDDPEVFATERAAKDEAIRSYRDANSIGLFEDDPEPDFAWREHRDGGSELYVDAEATGLIVRQLTVKDAVAVEPVGGAL